MDGMHNSRLITFAALLALATSAFGQDWGRAATQTFFPPAQIAMPQIAAPQITAVHPNITLPTAKRPWELTAKDYPRLYLPPKVGIFDAPPNVGENRRIK